MRTLRALRYNNIMEERCRICGLLDAPGIKRKMRMCYLCQGAYQRFRNDPKWGTIKKGGLTYTNGRLTREPGSVREVPNVPSGNWFRYIVRERLLRGLTRYPYVYSGKESDTKWLPDKKYPWDDVHTVPHDLHKMTSQQAIALEIVDIHYEEPIAAEGHIGQWGPPVT